MCIGEQIFHVTGSFELNMLYMFETDFSLRKTHTHRQREKNPLRTQFKGMLKKEENK